MKSIALSSPVKKLAPALIAALIATCLFSFAVPQARAAQLTEVQQQAILNLLSSFNVDQTTIDQVGAILAGDTVTSTGTSNTQTTSTDTHTASSTGDSTPPPGGPCGTSTRPLSFGAQGGDVEDLQSFLSDHGYLDHGNTTGFFGQLTQHALQRWQSDNAVATSGGPSTTGWGVFGPLSQRIRDYICGNDHGSTRGTGEGTHNTTTAPAVVPVCTLDCAAGTHPSGPAGVCGRTCIPDTAANSNTPTTNTSCPPPQPATPCNGTWSPTQTGALDDTGVCTIGWTCVPGSSTNSNTTSAGTNSTVGGVSAPSCTISAVPASITAGGNATLGWASSSANSASLNGSPAAINGSRSITPSETTSYTLLVSNAVGNNKCSASVTVTPAATTTATTTAATTTSMNAGAPDVAGAILGFLADYSDAFNQNMAAVVAAPVQLAIDSLTNIFVSLGVGQ